MTTNDWLFARLLRGFFVARVHRPEVAVQCPLQAVCDEEAAAEQALEQSTQLVPQGYFLARFARKKTH